MLNAWPTDDKNFLLKDCCRAVVLQVLFCLKTFVTAKFMKQKSKEGVEGALSENGIYF